MTTFVGRITPQRVYRPTLLASMDPGSWLRDHGSSILPVETQHCLPCADVCWFGHGLIFDALISGFCEIVCVMISDAMIEYLHLLITDVCSCGDYVCSFETHGRNELHKQAHNAWQCNYLLRLPWKRRALHLVCRAFLQKCPCLYQ